MTIEPMTAASFPVALEVYRQSWRESHRMICSEDFLENRDYAGYLAGLPGMFLIWDGDCVGVFRLFDDTLSDLYIHPRYQKMGYGRACVKYAIAHGGHRLTVLSTNRVAIGFYEKMGFRFTGRDIFLKPGLLEREMEYTEK